MNKTKGSSTLIILLLIAILSLGWYWTTNNQSKTSAPSSQTTQSEEVMSDDDKMTENTDVMTEHEQVIVTYNGSSFTPITITIEPGTEVVFLNESESTMWVASNPHPIHTDYSAFDELGIFDQYTFLFEEVGTYKYHNHTKFSVGGSVIVQK